MNRAAGAGERLLGVEEEFLLVGSDGSLRSGSDLTVARAKQQTNGRDNSHDFARELKQQQVESGTAVCRTLDELAAELRDTRAELADSAAAQGWHLAALGTSPRPVDPISISDPRAHTMTEKYGLMAHEMLCCGTHVHVSVDSAEQGVAVLDRIRPWLSVLTAMTANSPYWQGQDTGYASYRTVVWNRLPTAGPYELFGTPGAYQRAVQALIDSGGSLDRGTIYFDARLSDSYPTVEIRAADSLPTVDDAVLLAALCRAMVERAADQAAAGQPVDPVRLDLLRVASWRAARSGLSAELIDAHTGRAVPAREQVSAFVEHLRPALGRYGDEERIKVAVADLLRRGTGADLQRADFARRQRLTDVVDAAVRRAATGSDGQTMTTEMNGTTT